jgi:hypothetical protein
MEQASTETLTWTSHSGRDTEGGATNNGKDPGEDPFSRSFRVPSHHLSHPLPSPVAFPLRRPLPQTLRQTLEPPAHQHCASSQVPASASRHHPAGAEEHDAQLLIGTSLGFFSGGLIGLITLLVPLASVVSDRGTPPAASSIQSPPPTLQRHGSTQAGSFPGTRDGEPAGGDPRRQHE